MNVEQLEMDAPNGWFSRFDMEYLYPEVAKIKKGVYVEIGTYDGRSLWTAEQAAGPDVKLYGVDIRPAPKIKGTEFILGDSVDVAEKWDQPIDVLFIDGDHSYEGCKRDIDAWYPHMKKNGVMLFHDCDETSPGVVQAVEEFVKNNKFKDVHYSPNQRCSIARIRL